MDKIISDLLALIVPAAKSLVFALLVLIIGFKVVNTITKRLKNKKTKNNIDESASGFLISFTGIALKTIVIVSAISILGIPMSSIVALVASAGVAIGLAVQGALSNFVGGIMILIFKPFRVGDFIEAQTASGTVKEISVIYTSLLTPDNKFITVPNGTLTNSVITNYSAENIRRVDIDVSASYDADTELVKQTLLKAAESFTCSVSDPEPVAVIINYGESGINYALRFWCETEKYWDAKFEATEIVRNAFKQADIEIPYQKIDINIKKD